MFHEVGACGWKCSITQKPMILFRVGIYIVRVTSWFLPSCPDWISPPRRLMVSITARQRSATYHHHHHHHHHTRADVLLFLNALYSNFHGYGNNSEYIWTSPSPAIVRIKVTFAVDCLKLLFFYFCQLLHSHVIYLQVYNKNRQILSDIYGTLSGYVYTRLKFMILEGPRSKLPLPWFYK